MGIDYAREHHFAARVDRPSRQRRFQCVRDVEQCGDSAVADGDAGGFDAVAKDDLVAEDDQVVGGRLAGALPAHGRLPICAPVPSSISAASSTVRAAAFGSITRIRMMASKLGLASLAGVVERRSELVAGRHRGSADALPKSE